jgi:hypothetical protein
MSDEKSSECSSDEGIGEEVESQLPNKAQKVPKRRWTKRMPVARRQQAIELKLLGKEDPEYHVIEREKKGSYIVRKRVRPLTQMQPATMPSNGFSLSPNVANPIPINPVNPVSVSPINPVNSVIPSSVENKNPDIPILSYFNNQSTFNTSLSKELNDLREMYARLESKYTEVKKTLKKKKEKRNEKKQVSEEEFEPTEEEINAYEQYLLSQREPEPQIQPAPVRTYSRRRVIDINRF